MGMAASVVGASVQRASGTMARAGSVAATRRGASTVVHSGALAALCTVARLHQVAADPETLRHRLGLAPNEPLDVDDLLRAAQLLGLRAKRIRSRIERLVQTPLPALALMQAGSDSAASDAGLQVKVLAQCDGRRVLVMGARAGEAARVEPGDARRDLPGGVPQIEPLEVFAAQWTGALILISSRASLAGELARFDFAWFVPALVKYRRLLGEVLLVSFVLQLLGLVSPLFFQVVMDKVLVHRAMSTLDVLVIGLLVVVVFESVLSGVRGFVMSHTTSRIDVELGARLFRHLVSLPLAYFQARRVGDSVARVRELENIRQFLTGNALTVVLDLMFSIVFLALMAWYSLPLTAVVVVSLPMYFLLSLAVTPVLRRRLDIKFARGAENQAMLVETITGIQTVKAAALEPGFARRWDRQLAAYVQASFRTQWLASLAHEAVNLIGKLGNACTLWFGAHLVMDNSLTVGQFVAFTMFAQRVAQPIMRMAQLWTDFQQTGLSVARLGDILNSQPESGNSSALQLPPIKGRITLDQLRFRYRPDMPPVLNGVSLDVRAGECIGIVGRSGSGKSTLTKLVQRLYAPEGGRVLVDGVDISLIDAAQLRRQIGVVLQENLLFNRSIRENIAIADPAAPLAAVVRAAQLAGAHDFIGSLPQAYDTPVGEQGSSLSGGQRQRIALARALFTEPRILILDEATSALDYESEAIIQRNMAQICRDRTVLVIAHRLSAVRRADRIVVMDQGAIVEVGSHDELLARSGSLYRHLWRMQDGGAVVDADGDEAVQP
jgi:ATP-binding cassette, subfamily B, bacterial HlyB/CyaB